MESVLVIGGAGFIGSHIVELLCDLKYRVFVIDDLSAGYIKNVDERVFNFAEIDITDYVTLFRHINEIKRKYDLTTIFNQAASKKNVCLNDPRRDFRVNTEGTYNVLMTCHILGLKLIHASTGSVYGNHKGLITEDSEKNPVSFYGISKLAGESYIRMFNQMYNENHVILRYFHVYGERQENDLDKGGVIAIWLNQIKNKMPIVIHGDGKQVRSFTYVKDVAVSNIMAMNASGVYNVASCKYYTLNELVNLLHLKYGNFNNLYSKPLPGDIHDFEISNDKIKSIGMLNWTPLHEGLLEMKINSYR